MTKMRISATALATTRAAALALALSVPLMAAGPAAAQGGFFGSSSNNRDGELAVRMGQMEEQIRNLTGQVEELSHQLRQTQDQLRRLQEDNEFRFQELEGGNPTRPRNRSEAPSGNGSNTADNSIGNTGATGQYGRAPASGDDQYAAQRDSTVRDLGSYGVPAPGGGENDPGVVLGPSGRPLDLSALARGNASGEYQPDNPDNGVPGIGGTDDIGRLAATGGAGGSSRQEYHEAYSLVLRGDYEQAGDRFQDFLAAYPDDPLAANAQYWLGESYYGRGMYRDAADAFLKTYTDYPANDKAPDSLLKLGLSLNGLGQKDAACATYSELLTKYPSASGAVLNQARQEQKSAGCRG